MCLFCVLERERGAATTAPPYTRAVRRAPTPSTRVANMAAAQAALLGPLQGRVFRAIWIATVASNIGTWMQEVGAAWLMTTLTPDPFMVAMVQAATALPIFLFALPAGALADMVDRRRLLLTVQAGMLVVAAALAALSGAGLVTPWPLLACTFLLGLGAAFSAPAWQAVTPELVPPAQLTAAVALNSLGINVARAIGPALGGLLVALYGPALAFALNALSFVGVLIILYRWRRAPTAHGLPAERFLAAMRAGVRYARRAPPLRVVLVRAGAFFLFASALWALLPSVARGPLQLGAGGFGLLLGAVGLGAVLGASQLPALQRVVSTNQRVALASVLLAACTTGLALVQHLGLALGLMLLTGVAWILALSTLNVAAQGAAPAWVRGRVLATYLMVLFGGMALGSALWGQIAQIWGSATALLSAALGQILALLLSARYRLTDGPGADNAPSGHWPAPLVDDQVQPDQGPVLVTIEYRVDPALHAEFTSLARALGQARRRDGAFSWYLLRDAADPQRIVETFMTESWLEHLRQHERITEADRALQERMRQLSVAAQAATVRHFVAMP